MDFAKTIFFVANYVVTSLRAIACHVLWTQ
jgi:hypothetical protein